MKIFKFVPLTLFFFILSSFFIHKVWASDWVKISLSETGIKSLFYSSQYGLFAGILDDRFWTSPQPSNRIYRSQDKGTTWQLVGPNKSLGVSDLVQTGSYLFANTYYGGGVYKSSDGGTSWIHVGPQFSGKTLTVSEGVILAGSLSTQSIYRSTDYGETWQTVLTSIEPRVMTSLGKKVFLSTSSGYGQTGMWRSEDGGLTWTAITNPVSTLQPYLLALDNNIVLAGDANWPTVFRSDNNGSTWQDVKSWTQISQSNRIGPGGPFLKMGSTVFSGGSSGSIASTGIFQSTDKGLTWTDITQNLTIANRKIDALTSIDDSRLLTAVWGNGIWQKEITPPPPARTPLIFIPGIGGSELKTKETINWSAADGHGGTFSHSYPAGEKIWVNETEVIKPGNDDYFDILRMKSDGQTSEVDLELTGNIYSGSYGTAVNFFVSNGYTLDHDLFVFPYDWRKDVSETTPLLDQKIEQIKTQTSAQKVDIVAHSLGGLVARNYINDPVKATKIRKLITLGTPHLGAVRFLKALQYGDCLYLEVGPFCLSIAQSEAKDIIQNLISGYELAPSQKYYDFYSGKNQNYPYPFKDDRDIDNNAVTGPLNYNQIKTLLNNLGHNTTLFTPSETFHTIDNSLENTNGVEVYVVAGSGIPTLGQIVEKYLINFSGIKISHKDMLQINGDGTVPLFSASLTDPSRSISLLGSAKVYYAKQSHPDLVSTGPALNLTKNILNGNSTLPSNISAQA